ncbi:MAG: bifunctional riboflavin kinase/FAD synthetase [Verrucomicrobiales bacterium]
MRIESFSELNSIKGVVNIAIGIFDGIHRGHLKVISKACSKPEVSVVLTFEPHPMSIISPEKAPPIISSIDCREVLLNELGVNKFMVLPFDKLRAGQEPEEFVEELVSNCDLGSISVGDDFRFGKGRKGCVKLLKKFSEKYQFEVFEIERVKDENGLVISSSRVREKLLEGDFQAVSDLLGREFALSGPVIKGKGLGRQIGVPTANIDCNVPGILRYGVYAVKVAFENQEFQGIANLGFRPTVNKDDNICPLLEVHLFNFDANLYGKRLAVNFKEFIRPEIKFNSLDELKSQIKDDINCAKKSL